MGLDPNSQYLSCSSNGNLFFPFFFHFQPRVRVFFVFNFFKIWATATFYFLVWFKRFWVNKLLITWASIIFLIWATTTVSDCEIGRFLFSPKFWIFQECYALFACPRSVRKLWFLIMDFSLFRIRVMGKISTFLLDFLAYLLLQAFTMDPFL